MNTMENQIQKKNLEDEIDDAGTHGGTRNPAHLVV